MIPRRGKERKGKRHCDLCDQEQPPIYECAFHVYDGRTHWFDLCAKCAAVDRTVRDGFLVGIHHPIPVSGKPIKIDFPAPTAEVQRAKGRKRENIGPKVSARPTGSLETGKSKQASRAKEATG